MGDNVHEIWELEQMKQSIITFAAVYALVLGATSCGGTNSNPVGIAPVGTAGYVQIERLARPAIKEATENFANHDATNRVSPESAGTDSVLSQSIHDFAKFVGRDEAQRLIETNAAKSDISTSVITSRWDEISGHLDEAQRLLVRAMHYADSIYEFPAERRAWFHFRLGELKYLGGDNAGAIASERDAIAIYPNDFYAWQALARIASADKRHDEAEAAAKTAAALVPSPEVLGILADEQTARGETQDAAASRAQIDAVEKLGNAQHVNDRLIAMYFADHDVRTSDAYAIAKRELTVRDDIYAEDTLAWCAAKAGRWDEARRAAQKALRFDTQDPRMQYHAGIIAQHAGDTAEAVKRFNRALALNPNFSATQADDARTRLEALKKG
ncbi:MAG: hypothetical protein NVS2B17_21100 [Candidatus Velthaea sp.]